MKKANVLAVRSGRQRDKEGTSMKTTDGKINAEWFYENEEGKTKLNWFLYEVALEYQMHIKDTPELKAYRDSQGDQNIALFCTHFAKQMKKSILDMLSGKADAIIFDDKYISSFYPLIGKKQLDLLMDVMITAWDSHAYVCEACPTRCITERDEKCYLFDSYAESGLL
jgi:hypothetical protein